MPIHIYNFFPRIKSVFSASAECLQSHLTGIRTYYHEMTPRGHFIKGSDCMVG